jgi:hypothetical protein
MKRIRSATCAVFALVVGIACFAQAPQGSSSATPATPTFSIKISAPPDPIKLAGPIEISILVTNISNHDIPWETYHFGVGPGYRAFRVLLTKDGREVGTTLSNRQISGRLRPDDPPPPSLGGKTMLVLFAAGQSFTSKIDLTHLYEITEPGEYILVLSRNDEATKSTVYSNTLTLKIVQ